MRVVLGWVIALLVVIGTGVGAEAACGVDQPAANSGTVTGVLGPAGWTAYAPLPDSVGEIEFYPAGAGALAKLPTVVVRVSRAGRFVAHLKPGPYVVGALPCGSTMVDVRPGTTQILSISCKAVVISG